MNPTSVSVDLDPATEQALWVMIDQELVAEPLPGTADTSGLHFSETSAWDIDLDQSYY